MLGRIRLMLEGPDSDETENSCTIGLRQRVHELRQEIISREVEDHTAGAWWDQAITTVRTWLDEKEPGRLFSSVFTLPLNSPAPPAIPSSTVPRLRSPSCGQM